MSQEQMATEEIGLGKLCEQPEGAQGSIIRDYIRSCFSEDKELNQKSLHSILNALTVKISQNYNIQGVDARCLLDKQFILLVNASLRDTY